MQQKVIYIDTNIFLHFRFFDQIDWLRVLEADQVEIRLPSTVIQELDKHKYNNNSPKIGQRATKVIKKLSTLSDSAKKTDEGFRANLSCGVDILFEVDDIDIDVEAISSQDARILISVLTSKRRNPDSSILLVAADLGMKLTARSKGIEAICLSDDYRLPIEVSQDKKRIEELERENLELKRAIPELKLTFEEGSDKLISDIRNPSQPGVSTSDIVTYRLEQIKQAHPKLPEIPSGNEGIKAGKYRMYGISGSEAAEILPQEISSYNKLLDKFYADYEQYLKNSVKWRLIASRSILLKILLSNTGTCPARDISISMHFPDGFVLNESEDFPDAPEQPEPPAAPVARTKEQRLASLMSVPIMRPLPPYLGPHSRTPPNVSNPRIRRTNSYDVEVSIERIKQNTLESIGELAVTFDSYEDASSFRINYQINAENLPRLVTGSLHVIVNKNSETEA